MLSIGQVGAVYLSFIVTVLVALSHRYYDFHICFRHVANEWGRRGRGWDLWR